MTTSVVVVTSYDPAWLAVFEHIVRTELAAGHATIVVDSTGLATTPIDSYHRGVLRVGGLKFPGHDIAERMRALGAEYRRAEELPGAGDTTPLERRLEDLLDIAIVSALTTFFRTDRPNQRKRIVRRTTAGLADEGRAIYRALRSLCDDAADVTRAFVPNGRFPIQRLATCAFGDLGIDTFNVEKGERPGRAFVQDYGPHDRLRSQASVGSILSGLDDAHITEIADAWLARRAPAATPGRDNRFASLWSDDLPPDIAAMKHAGKPIAGFFTSSQDEFAFLGPEWQTQEWGDQFEAFHEILTRFEARGFGAYLRVHPNLASKASDSFRRERDAIRALAARHPDLVVIWHDAAANSYALLDASEAVVVWLSTLGLEASARGIPVWTTATSRYGLIADIREVLSVADLDRVGLETWEVDERGAKRFIAYLDRRDQEMAQSKSWMPWDPAHAPLAARAAAIAVSGGTPSVGEALRSLSDVYLHRRPSANLRALRRRR